VYVRPESVDLDHIGVLGGSISSAGDWIVKLWPTCGEATMTFQKARSNYVDWDAPFDRHDIASSAGSWYGGEIEDNATRAVRRARSEVRRYNRHNGLLQMVTFTFRGDVPEFDSLSRCVENFWKRFKRATGREDIGPYLWVPEWGKMTGRLHVHMAVNWWHDLNCVEVCSECDRFGVLERFNREIISEALCVGCLWGLGFVGRPLDNDGELVNNDDGRGLSKYLSKYMAKDLGGGVRLGGQRYRVAQGYAPESVTLRSVGPVEGLFDALGVLADSVSLGGLMPEIFVPSDSSDWCGPPVVVLDWKGQSVVGKGSEKCD
jgi:hypothetical protein